MKKIAVIGSGLMGGGISQVSAQAGYNVTMIDTSDEILQKSLKNIVWSVGKLIEKGKVEGDRDEIVSRIRATTKMEDAGDADIVVEAVFEKLEIKQEVFAKLGEICSAETILATNTSAIPITEIASAAKNPERVVGIHFFNPAPLMRAVEVIRGTLTGDAAMDAAREYVKSLGKEPITVNKDIAGFLLNRINLPSTVEAIRLLEAGVASAEDIDKGMRLGYGRPMGPLETGDMTGLDVTYGALMALYNETRDPKFYPPVLLQRKVRAGHLGRKTGRGWYEYDKNGERKG